MVLLTLQKGSIVVEQRRNWLIARKKGESLVLGGSLSSSTRIHIHCVGTGSKSLRSSS